MSLLRKSCGTFLWRAIVTSCCALLLLLRSAPGHADEIARWIAVTPQGGPPPVQSGDTHARYDASSNRLIVYIPGNPAINAAVSNQVWILENANGVGSGPPRWTKLDTLGLVPTISIWPLVDYDAGSNQLVVYGGGGGFTSPPLSDVFVLSHANGLGGTPTWSVITVGNPQTRVHHAGFLDPTTDSLVSFGGSFAFFGTTQGDLRRLSNASGNATPSTWTTLLQAGDLPGPTEGATLVAHPRAPLAVLFGGHNANGPNAPVKNEARLLREATGFFGTPTWSLVPAPTGLTGRTGHVAVIDPDEDRMIVQGGATFEAGAWRALDDAWELRPLSGVPEWAPISMTGTGPGVRWRHSGVWDAASKRLIMVGGRDAADVSDMNVWILAFEPANQPPSANAGADRTVAADADCVARVALDGTHSSDPDGDALTYMWSGSFGTAAGPTPIVPLPKGAHGLVLSVSDGHDSDSASVTITVTDVSAPLFAGVPPSALAECVGPNGTPLSLPLPTANDACDGSVPVVSHAPTLFPLGVTPVTFDAVDQSGNLATAQTSVTVRDSRPPGIQQIVATPGSLWPPNGKMVPVAVSVSASDTCSPGPISCRIVEVRSNEPAGTQAPDWEITGALTVKLRAEREGHGQGRVYSVVVDCPDASGNLTKGVVEVTVSHDQGSR